MDSVGKRIKSVRLQNSLTQKELADLLGCAQTTVANWENQEKRSPDKETLKKIAKIFDLSTDYLLNTKSLENQTRHYGQVKSFEFDWNLCDLKHGDHDTFAFQVMDNNLEPFILEKDICVFQRREPQNGNIVVVELKATGKGMIRKWQYENQILLLLHTNPSVKNNVYANIVVKDLGPFEKELSNDIVRVRGVMVETKRFY